MSSSPFVGEHAEYYRRRTLQAALKRDSVSRENEYLRQKVLELENEIASYEEKSIWQLILKKIGIKK